MTEPSLSLHQPLYKFRGRDQLDFALDIIVNQRLYCARIDSFNDPMEGEFSSYPILGIEHNHHAINDLNAERAHVRVCSLSFSVDHIPMWAYYASNFAGMAIEINIPTSTYGTVIRDVRYTDSPWIGTLHHDDPKKAAIETLCMKRMEWENEREIRVISDTRETSSNFFEIDGLVRRVIVGPRADPTLLGILKELLKGRNIGLAILAFNRVGVEVKDVNG